MKFKVLGRDVEVNWIHLAIAFLMMFGLSVFFGIMIILYSFTASGNIQSQTYNKAYSDFSIILVTILGVVIEPLLAFLMLWAALRIFRFVKDDSLCRSLAASYFALFGIPLAIINVLMSFVTGVFSNLDPFGMLLKLIDRLVSIPLGAAFTAIMIYLWLLILIKPEKEKLARAVKLAGIFSVSLFILVAAIKFIWNYQSGSVPSLGYSLADALFVLVGSLIFSFPILYSFQKKLNMEAYLFAGIYLFPIVVSMILMIADETFSSAIVFSGNPIAYYLAILGKKMLELALIYLIASWKID